MAKKKLDPDILAHLEWLGFVQPTGLVVSALALIKAGAILQRRDVEGQTALKECVVERPGAGEEESDWYLPDFETFARQVLGWGFSPKYYAGTEESPMPEELEVALPAYGETLRADYAVREREPGEGQSAWQLLVRVLDPGEDIDRQTRGAGRLEASEHGRMERLLRQTGVLAGLIFNGETVRLISAPRGESSGWLDFKIPHMLTTPGRPISTAMRLLLGQNRLLIVRPGERLTDLLEDSRRYQNEVSERLAEQVLHALYELLRGFQAADDASRGELLRHQLRERPDEVYHALLTVLLRLVFILYAEERDMLPEDETFVQYYSLAALHKRLREDAALYPDTMDQRFGAWAQLLTLFRMIHDGARSQEMHLPERHGVLFDPDRFSFLEGRTEAGARQIHERIHPPLVPDGTVYRVLEKLLVLDGERISYRALDVEQIGSVYETMMGFRLETAHGRSLAIRPAKRMGAPTTIDLDELLTVEPAKREKWFRDQTDQKPAAAVTKEMKAASTLEELHAALDRAADRAATPDLVPPGSMVLQPSEERRRSGSHYTPRSLTAPIVSTTLQPILERLKGPNGEPPRPEEILELKVCDPAMGSGAFLVETCRQLADILIESWEFYAEKPEIPANEDRLVFARRLVAQRCLYGVDKNPVAVDLAKMSLWLATLAREHPLTFVDHALKHGDSLVGLTPRQIEGFHWDAKKAGGSQAFVALGIREHTERATEIRELIRQADDDTPEQELKVLLGEAEEELAQVKPAGDLVTAAFFLGARPRDRETKLATFVAAVEAGEADKHQDMLAEWRHADPPLVPFHWELEYPEVFQRDNPGFDAFVGNPPFAGKNTMAAANPPNYPDWLKTLHEASHGNSDLVAHFFRRAFVLIREAGAFGLIATNTIAQGDTRSTGLAWIGTHGGEIYSATRRLKWPGLAAVVVSVIHVCKGLRQGEKVLDGRRVEKITAFLFHRGGHDDPARLVSNAGKSFVGSYVLGMGFTFDDTDTRGVATPIAEMHRLIEQDPANAEVIFPYIGGEEVNTSPTHAHHRYVINFRERSEEECRQRWPELMAIVEEKVKPERAKLTNNVIGRKRARYWWHYGSSAKELYGAIAGLERVLVISRVGQRVAFALLPAGMVYAESTVVFPFSTQAAFCALQSRPHEVWARFFGSSLEDRLRYTPSDVFETFPFPEDWESHPVLEQVGEDYYEFRAALMVQNDEGLTKTYNRFHDPEEDSPDILKLRELHEAMDRAVLDAYGWTDIPTECEFLLDYEVDEEDSGRRKKPWRYRWPDEVRDELLARLLELNAERAAEEARAGAGAKKSRRGKKASSDTDPDVRSLF
ncbi:MAG: N-6 DNA methylase [Actinobacteria bacterium]|nr:N-6 DNA methylase [Actinomycetota bacterium]